MGFKLSAKEFLFLCFAAGAKQVYGVEDAFGDDKISDISSEIRRIHRALEGKKLVLSDFDGNSSINKQLLKTVRCFADCSVAVLFTASANHTFRKINYYFKGNSVVKAQKETDGYTVSDFDGKEFVSDLVRNMSLRAEGEFENECELIFPQKELEQLKKEVMEGNRETARSIISGRASDAVLDVLISALGEKEDFYSVSVIHTDNSDETGSVMIIDSQQGALLIQPFTMGLRTAIMVKACSRNSIQAAVKRLIDGLVIE